MGCDLNGMSEVKRRKVALRRVAAAALRGGLQHESHVFSGVEWVHAWGRGERGRCDLMCVFRYIHRFRREGMSYTRTVSS